MRLELDAGEHDDEPEPLWQLFDLLSIACGDAAPMSPVIAACVWHGIAAGAHSSYPDREGFEWRTIAFALVA